MKFKCGPTVYELVCPKAIATPYRKADVAVSCNSEYGTLVSIDICGREFGVYVNADYRANPKIYFGPIIE